MATTRIDPESDAVITVNVHCGPARAVFEALIDREQALSGGERIPNPR